MSHVRERDDPLAAAVEFGEEHTARAAQRDALHRAELEAIRDDLRKR